MAQGRQPGIRLDYVIITASCKDRVIRQYNAAEARGHKIEIGEVICKNTDLEVTLPRPLAWDTQPSVF